MGSLTGTVVVLLLANAVLGTPLINELQPGQEWPTKHSVKQPYHDIEDAKIATEATEEIYTSDPIEDVEYSTEDPVAVENPAEQSSILKAALLGKEEPEKVDYSGAQLWKVSTEKSSVRVTLLRLRRRNLISTWGGNNSTIDVLIKSDAISNVTRIFKRDNIPFDVVIEDLQKRINEENPPLDDNELELQDRRARAYNFWRYRGSHRRIGYIGAYMGYNSLDIPMEYWPNANWGSLLIFGTESVFALQKFLTSKSRTLESNVLLGFGFLCRILKRLRISENVGLTCHRMTWKQYHRLEDIHGFMDYLAKTYPSIVSVKSIGKSYEGRDLKVLRISNGQPRNKAIFIDGGIHAREWISPATVTYFINQFAENFDVESDDIKNIDWYFLPVVNPDGYEFTHTTDRLWRKNRKPGYTPRCMGADLNRNFGYRWGGKGASNNPCSEIYRGARAFSEPETKAMSDFIKQNAANFTAYLTYHSYGQYLLYPWGYDNALPPDHQQLDLVGKRIAEAIKQAGGSEYSVGSSSGLLYPAAGGSDDWAKGEGIKYTYTIELSDTGRYGFVLPTSFIEPVARESMAGLRVLAKTVRSDF